MRTATPGPPVAGLERHRFVEALRRFGILVVPGSGAVEGSRVVGSDGGAGTGIAVACYRPSLDPHRSRRRSDRRSVQLVRVHGLGHPGRHDGRSHGDGQDPPPAPPGRVPKASTVANASTASAIPPSATQGRASASETPSARRAPTPRARSRPPMVRARAGCRDGRPRCRSTAWPGGWGDDRTNPDPTRPRRRVGPAGG